MEIKTIPGTELESDLTLFSQGSSITGKVSFDRFTRLHGKIEGEILGLAGSTIVVAESGAIYANIQCEEIIIDGFVHGNIHATKKVTISESGRLLGNVVAPKFEVRFGAHFEGKANTMKNSKLSASHSLDTIEPSGVNLSLNPSKA